MLVTTLALAIHLNVPADSRLPILPDLPIISRSQVSDPLPRRGTMGVAFVPVPADVASNLGLKAGVGLLAKPPLPGSTAEKAGIKDGDVILSLNGKSVNPQTVGPVIRELRSGKGVEILVLRDGKELKLSAILAERPRDPGGANYTVEYSHIVSNGKRMRTIITTPKKPGKYPGFMFIQGLAPISYDFPLATSKGDVSSLDGPLLHDFADGGFITIRVEKPGVGDSEGGPYNEMDYNTELDIYRQTMKQFKEISGVDKDNIFIFGHSMGGAFGPQIACETPVKGIAVYGTQSRTWLEYLFDIVRYQGIAGGGSYEDADESVRQVGHMMALLILEGKSVDEVKKSHPQFAPLADAFFPNGRFNDKSLPFWRQLNQTNFATYWSKCNARVLAVHGASDHVTYDVDHQLIADMVNRANPGYGKFEVIPDSDHLFHGWKTQRESIQNFGKGTYNPAFSKRMMEWMRSVIAEK